MMNTIESQCAKCVMHKTRTQIVFPHRVNKGGLLVIGEAPGAEEDIAGDGFVGRAGKTLDNLLKANGIERNQYGRSNICRCRPIVDKGRNRKPTNQEIESCLPWLKNEIEQAEPSVILCVGWTSGKYFFEGTSLFDALKRNNGHREFHPGQFGSPSLLTGIKRKTTVLVMPHTSPLAFNRNAPDGNKWSEYCAEQVKLAASKIQTSA